MVESGYRLFSLLNSRHTLICAGLERSATSHSPQAMSLREPSCPQTPFGMAMDGYALLRCMGSLVWQVREVTEYYTNRTYRWRAEAILALHEAAEAYLVNLFEDTCVIQLHSLPRDALRVLRRSHHLDQFRSYLVMSLRFQQKLMRYPCKASDHHGSRCSTCSSDQRLGRPGIVSMSHITGNRTGIVVVEEEKESVLCMYWIVGSKEPCLASHNQLPHMFLYTMTECPRQRLHSSIALQQCLLVHQLQERAGDPGVPQRCDCLPSGEYSVPDRLHHR